jgi:hypothetical protein
MKYTTVNGKNVYGKDNQRLTKNGTPVYFIGNKYTTNPENRKQNRNWNALVKKGGGYVNGKKVNWKPWSEF